MVCGGKEFTEDDPAIVYKGYTDHLSCFAKEFISNFSGEDSELSAALNSVTDLTTLARLNSAWAAIGISDTLDSVICWAPSKKQLEAEITALILNRPAFKDVRVFNKGADVASEIQRTIVIGGKADENSNVMD
jgi:hypothetical protein